jgi:hypothetical protein
VAEPTLALPVCRHEASLPSGHPACGATAVSAVRMTSVTASGCEIMITWEPSISVIVAPARWAIDLTTSAPAALSPVPTAAQVGRSFHATCMVSSTSAAAAIGR